MTMCRNTFLSLGAVLTTLCLGTQVFAQSITLDMTVDNSWQVWRQESSTLLTLVDQADFNTSTLIANGQQVTIPYTNECTIYVTAWGDSAGGQGFIGTFRGRNAAGNVVSSINTGDARIQVIPSGLDKDGADYPTYKEVAQTIADANAQGTWVTPTGGPVGFNDPNAGTLGMFSYNIPAVSSTARWIWYESGTSPLPSWPQAYQSTPFAAYDHGEFMVFRLPCAELLSGVDVIGESDHTPIRINPVLTVACVAPPSGLNFWFAHDGQWTDRIAGVQAVQQGSVSSIATPMTDMGIGVSTNSSVFFAVDPALDVGTSDFTIDFWVNIPAGQSGSSVRPLLDYRIGLNPSGYRGYHMFTYQGRIGIQLADGAHTNFIAPTNIEDGAWHFIAVTVDRDNPQGGIIYVDGTAVHTFNPTARSGPLSGARLALGTATHGVSQSGTLSMDEVELFSRALTASEISSLARQPKCK